jgi:hypothetical protein
MRNKLLFFFLIFTLNGFSQDLSRKMLKGIVVSDSLEVENITIKNTTSQKLTITDAKGNFSLFAKEKDTLIFSGVSFKSSVLVVSFTHLEEEILIVRLKVRVNELEELIVRPYTLTGNLETDTKKLKVKIIDLNLGNLDLSDPIPRINKVDNALKSVMPGTGNDFNGVDFIALGSMIGKAIFKPKPKEKKIEFITEKNFVDAVKEKFSTQFFTGTLKLKEEEIELFLNYCDSNSLEVRALLNPKKEFELIDFLLKKSEEYLKKNR